jgi:transcriptional enhancer factor
MEPRHIQPSSLPSRLPLDNSALSRARQPLAHAAGSAQQLKQALASVCLHDYTKTIQLRMDMPNFMVPSQPSRLSLGNTLELRRQSVRRQKQLRFAHNPIQKSPQYRAYRERQQRDGNAEDQKWPDVLEDAFLNGKFSLP